MGAAKKLSGSDGESVTTENLDLNKIEFLKVLGQGATAVIHHVKIQGQSFALKLARTDTTHRDELSRSYSRESFTLARICSAGIPQIYDVGDLNGVPYILMEYIEGASLEKLVSNPLSADRLLSLATELTERLSVVHLESFVHNDIKSSNVIIKPDQSVCLIDFGYAAQSGKRVSNSNLFTGTLQYASPEKTGKIKRPVDCRSDLYSLGVLLFECATGQLPFQTQSVTELVQMHATQKPPMVLDIRGDLPLAWSAVIDKLLAKDPDDRYQSAECLLYDLARIEDLSGTLLSGAPVQLRHRPVARVQSEHTMFAGRRAEITQLGDSLDRGFVGGGSYACIIGPPGIGKSRLAREVIGQKQERINYFGSAKCSDDDPLPLAPIRRCVEGLLSNFINSAGSSKEELLERIKLIAGSNSGVLKGLCPTLGRALSHVQQESSLGNEMPAVVADFLANFAVEAGPVILLIDDLQWMDASSWSVMRSLRGRISKLPMNILFTSRDDQESFQKLTEFQAEMKDCLDCVVTLKPLDSDEIGEIVNGHFGGHQVDSEITKVLANYCQGFPFVINEVINSLLENQIVNFSKGRWRLDQDNLSKIDFSLDAIEFINRRILLLPEDLREIIGYVGAFGFTFSLEEVAYICGENFTAVEVEHSLDAAVNVNLIERVDSQRYSFIHDCIFEAASAILPTEKVVLVHQRSAEFLKQKYIETYDPTLLFAMAAHYTQGDHSDLKAAFDANYDAGRLSIESYNGVHAKSYYDQAKLFAAKAGIELDATFYKGYIQACSFSGDVEEAYAGSHLAAEKSKTQLETAEVYVLAADLAFIHNDTVKAETYIRKAFLCLGRRMPETFRATPWNLITMLTGVFIVFFFPAGLKLGQSRQRKYKALSSLYVMSTYLGFFDHKVPLLFNSYLSVVLPGTLLGLSREKVLSLTWLGGLSASLMLRPLALYWLKRAERLAMRLGDRKTLASAGFYRGIVHTLMGDFKGAEKVYEEQVKPKNAQWLTTSEFNNLTGDYGTIRFVKGDHRHALDLVYGRVFERLRFEHKNEREIDRYHPWLAFTGICQACFGDKVEAQRFLDRADRVCSDAGNPHWMEVNLRCLTLAVMVESNQVYGDEFEATLRRAQEILIHPILTPGPQKWFFGTIARARYKQLILMNQEPERILAEFAKALRELGMLKVIPVFRAQYLILKAGYFEQLRKYRAALRCLEKAERIVLSEDMPNSLMDLSMVRARVYRATGMRDLMVKEVHFAKFLGLKHEYYCRLEELQLQFPSDVDSSNSGLDLSQESDASASDMQVRLNALQEISVALTTSLNPHQKIKQALNRVVELMCAERAFLILNPESDLGYFGSAKLAIGRDSEGNDLEVLEDFSSSIVRKVFYTRKLAILVGGEAGSVALSQSVIDYNLRSIMAAPVQIGERMLGVIYLDSRLAGGYFSQDDGAFLVAIANHIALALEGVRATNVELKKKELELSMEIAGTLQGLYLPDSDVRFDLKDGFYVCGSSRSADTCNGDWWSYRHSDQRIQVILGDVTGHGTPSAMITAGMVNGYTVLNMIDENMPISAVLSFLNRSLYLMANGQFLMTFSAIEADLERGVWRITSAGSPMIWHFRADGSNQVITLSGTLLGMGQRDLELNFVEIPIQKGDRFIFATDAIHETKTFKSSAIRPRVLMSIVEATKNMSAEAACGHIIHSVDQLRKGPQTDDMSVVIVGLD